MLPVDGDVVRRVRDVVLVVAKVDHRLRVGQAPHQLGPPALVDVAHVARELTQRLAALRLRLGAQQVREPLDLDQVDLVVVERALRELARLGCSAALAGPP